MTASFFEVQITLSWHNRYFDTDESKGKMFKTLQNTVTFIFLGCRLISIWCKIGVAEFLSVTVITIFKLEIIFHDDLFRNEICIDEWKYNSSKQRK